MNQQSLALTALSLLLLSSCMRQASMEVLQPAEIKIPEHISTIAVIDRSKPSNGWSNVLEGVFTGEAIGQDRRSREQAVAGLTNALTRTPRFQVKSTSIEMTGSKAGARMPVPLDWRDIEKICKDYDADAVAAIESFDTDNSNSNRRSESKSKNKKTGVETITVTWYATQRTSVRMGWRLYDPKRRVVIDEYSTDDYLERKGSGNTEQSALRNLPSPTTVSRDVAYIGGQHYGMRIAPVYVRLSRPYYPKAKGFKKEMKEAAQYASSNKWDKAAEIWKRVEIRAGKTNTKAAGRAAYNMAVAAEVSGKLDVALQWAENASAKYNNKSARRYIDQLKQRQYDARRVEDQMN